MPDDSHETACQYVTRKIQLSFPNVQPRTGDTVGVLNLRDCDCIPVTLSAVGVSWRLVAVDELRSGLLARYEVQ